MTKTFKKYLIYSLGILTLLVFWEISAHLINLDFVLPSIEQTLIELFHLVITSEFYISVLLSFARIILGLLIGIVSGILLAFSTHYIPYLKVFFSPMLTIIKSTPVASFIMVLWLIIGSSYVPTVIATLMVMPIIWQNLENGFMSIDKSLVEVCDIYGVTYKKRLKILIFPELKKYLIPAIITSAGLAWKSGIAAEIISYTKNSIGRGISDAKAFLESGKMFAWTIIVVIFSLLIEKLLSLLTKGYKAK